MIDSSIDATAQLQQIDRMVADVEAMLPHGASSRDKLDALRRYVYEPGPWNGGRAFSYDHSDPFGQDLQNKLLADYLQDRQGNCITMPFLFVILGQRLGLDVVPALAPLHVLVKFTDDDGRTWNLETTSGAGFARDQHYRDQLPITDAAIANGIYLAPLNRRETMAAMAVLVVEHLIDQGRYEEAMDVAHVLLSQNPRFVYAMIKKGTAAYYLMRDEYQSRYATFEDVPVEKRGRLRRLLELNAAAFERAEALGWRQMDLPELGPRR
ncbi:MAG: transglutaminase family protein [Pseudomonadota bacterium]